MSETRFEELMRYVRFSDEDMRRLAVFHAAAAPHFERISREFYERTREHEEAHAVFSGEEQIARLQRSLVAWMHRLCTKPRDDAYFAETAKIGRIHVRVGLPQRYVFTAMALIRIAFEEIIDTEIVEPKNEMRKTLAKALDLELAIMLETYHEDFVARLRRIEELEREDLGRALARSENRYVNAVELAPYALIGIDAKGIIRLFNRQAERISGYERDQVIDRPFVEVAFSDDIRERHGALTSSVVSGDRTSVPAFESILRTRAGKTRAMRWQVAHAPSEGNDEVVAFAIGQDVTDEKAMAERTRQAEKLAAVGTLAAGLAHEIRNPLNGAHLHVTFLERGLRKGTADPEALDAVKVVADEIKRLSALVSEFLDFARPKPLERQVVSVQSIAARVGQLIAGDAATAHVELVTDVPKNELLVDADRSKLEQVLLNLLHNGIEAVAPQGGGKIVLSARREPLHAVIEVVDDGPGISGPTAQIFDAFYSTKPSGTGLGLAIVHRIVTDHGGTIDVETKPGRTVFRVTLPIASTSSRGDL
ncbi:MAG: protoglobin domain-containing protein [Polyangiales bacterium]